MNHALLQAYQQGAIDGGHRVKVINIAELEVTFLESQQQWQNQAPSAEIIAAQQAIAWADRIDLFFPLWMGTMPAKLNAFLEQTLRPDFVKGKAGGLRGTSVRLIVTMGMPAFIYRWYFGAHGLKNLQRNILQVCGAKPVRYTLIGTVEGLTETKVKPWLDKMGKLGAAGR